jgi:hypothetical protein
MTKLAPLAVAALLCAAVAGCTSDSSHQPNPIFDPPATVTQSTDGGHLVTADRGDLSAADFELASGVTTLIIHSGDIGTALYQLSTPVGAGQIPAAVVSGDNVVAQLTSSGVNGPSILNVVLSDAVMWTVHLDGGNTEANIDMRAGGLAELDFGAGVTRIDAVVPNEPNLLTVRMTGGATSFAVHAPANVPTRVTIGGGAGSATIDGTGHTGIAGGTVFAPADWPDSGARIDIDNTAGVSTFTLDRYAS